jgi:hypothetical protein
MTDGDKIAAAVMAAGLCSKGNANPDEYVQHYFEILQKMSQRNGMTMLSLDMAYRSFRDVSLRRLTIH